MRYTVLFAVMLAFVACAGFAGNAKAARWIPGSYHMVMESDASDFLELSYDSAFCDGIPRFGHRGEFPYEVYHVFDCSFDLDDKSCFDIRFAAIKGPRYATFRLKLIRMGHCYR